MEQIFVVAHAGVQIAKTSMVPGFGSAHSAFCTWLFTNVLKTFAHDWNAKRWRVPRGLAAFVNGWFAT
jgi:hypothetical protein